MRYIMEASDRDAILKNLEELEKQLRALEDILAKGPVAWRYERNGKVRYSDQRSIDMTPAWLESPLYFIPAPEPKP